MGLKHRITINVSDPRGNKVNILKGAERRLPTRLLKFLFGDYTQVYLLSPGQTIDSVDIKEIKEGGANEAVRSKPCHPVRA